MSDTIYALATARGKAGIAIVRISGPAARSAGTALAGSLPDPRRAGLRILRDASGEKIDEALTLVFEEDASFTGEAVVELHVHGSPAVVAALLGELRASGLRMAEPGEFTRRALLNGRMSITEVEGLGDLIEAETAAQRRQALRLLDDRLGQKAGHWREGLLRAAALLTVTIDFADEEAPADVSAEVRAILAEVHTDLEHEIAGSRVAERVRDGFEVALTGAPNAGKSTLLNFLAGRPAALTSAVAGTTRDIIEVRIDLGGLPVTLLDTAGLRDAADPVERMGVDLAVARARAADLRVFLDDGSAPPPDWIAGEDVVVRAKADLSGGSGVSGLTGAGVDRLTDSIAAILGARVATSGAAVNARHRQMLQDASGALAAADALIASGNPELVAESLRTAMLALDRLVGRVDVEQVLDEVFSAFCLGK